VSERTNRNLPGRNTLVQLLALYTDPDSHSAQRYRQTDGRTDGRHDANSRSFCVAVKSALKILMLQRSHESREKRMQLSEIT